jgi:hypothetical protein
MRKFIVVSIPLVSLAMFILVMLSGNYLKKPLGKGDNIPDAIQAVINNVNEGQWEEAANNTDRLNGVWKKVVRRVQFSSERDEINAFSMNVARLRGAIMAKDKSSSLSELEEVHEHWKQLGN